MAINPIFSTATRSALAAVGCCNAIAGENVFIAYSYDSKNLPQKSVGFSLIAERDNLQTALRWDSWNLKINIQHYGISRYNKTSRPYRFSNLHPLKVDIEKNIPFYDAQRILKMEFVNPSQMLNSVLKSYDLPEHARKILEEMKNAVDTNFSYASSDQVGAKLLGSGFVPAAISPLSRDPR